MRATDNREEAIYYFVLLIQTVIFVSLFLKREQRSVALLCICHLVSNDTFSLCHFIKILQFCPQSQMLFTFSLLCNIVHIVQSCPYCPKLSILSNFVHMPRAYRLKLSNLFYFVGIWYLEILVLWRIGGEQWFPLFVISVSEFLLLLHWSFISFSEGLLGYIFQPHNFTSFNFDDVLGWKKKFHSYISQQSYDDTNYSLFNTCIAPHYVKGPIFDIFKFDPP